MTTTGQEPLPPHRYGDREVARILKRATELQRAEPSAPDPAGLTLSDLTEIAREAGIDPEILRRAAAELEIGGRASTLGGRLAGAPLTLRIEQSVSGEIPVDRFDAIIPRIQEAAGGQGTASAVGRTLTWSSHTTDKTSSQQVLISSSEGRTLIRWEERFSGLAGALFGGIVAGGGVGIGLGLGTALGAALGSATLGFGLPVVIGGGSYMLARTIYSRIVRRREAAARQVVAEIAGYVATLSNSGRPPADMLTGGPAADAHDAE